jgi:uncharacterized protein (TIGR03084 family)
MVSAADIAADLAAEQGVLDRIVEPLDDEEWRLDTPSPGWRIADQIAHLAYFDHMAALAVTDPPAFAEHRDQLFAAGFSSPETIDAFTLAAARDLLPAELLSHWRAARSELAAAATLLDDHARIDWYGPSMSARSFLTARLMEVWAHGQDVADALGVDRPVTDRIRHIAQLGFITRGWTYANRGLPVPDTDVRVELTAPSGATWTWGPDDAPSAVVGSALDFVLVITQRRHRADTDLVTSDASVREWLTMAQAFAGPPTDGPAPQQGGGSTRSGDA